VARPKPVAIGDDEARRLAAAAGRAADEKLGEKTVVLDVRELTSLADCMVITAVSSPPHMKAVTDAVEEAVEGAGGRLHHREGSHDSPWVLLDFGMVIVHVFTGPAREYYDLERLWAEGRPVSFR
jgi:ribosome-associated protein